MKTKSMYKSIFKINLLFLFFFLFVIVSCETENTPPIDKSCSSTNLNGECEDNKSCINGYCAYECGEELNCPTTDYHCENNICYDTTKACSIRNHFGKCDESETCVEGVCKNLNPCNREFPTGICSSENRFCFEGICVEHTTECKPWNVNGFCPSNYYCKSGTCVHKKVYLPCSMQYPEGKCELDTDICINGLCVDKENSCSELSSYCPSGQMCEDGICNISSRYPCNDSNLFGYCENKDDVCYNGVCSSLVEACSSENPFGTCLEGSICNNGTCVPIVTECSENKSCPNLDRQFCENYHCLDKPIFCEDGAINGLCPENESCINFECKDITSECSASNLDGFCNGLNLKCIQGECLDSSQEKVCSSLHIDGNCPQNQVCNNGHCEGDLIQVDIGNSCIMDIECKDSLYCEKTFLDGYCTKDCLTNDDCTDNSTCYKVSQTNGYCLAKCSINIPNSCDRVGTENYICYPNDNNNDGICLYDCKYHGCFDTNKTCNQVSGICE